MTDINPTISIIIPTHNRCKTLESLLSCLKQQTYPLNLVEVIVIADGCSDTTIKMLKQYKAPYKIHYAEQDGKGAAVARNTGAALATGTLLLFLDDDIEPSTGLVKAHVCAHQQENRVVIGYLPFVLPKNAGFYHLKLWAWWEDKFQQMRNPGYWYSYEDLLSGNFSLPAELFHRIKGFDSAFRCREDYELGIRLIKAGADFFFTKDAWGYHRDVVTDLSRSLFRKKQEGRADVRFGRLHPDLIRRLKLSHLGIRHNTFLKSLLLFCVFNTPSISDGMASGIQRLMKLIERLRWRLTWQNLSMRLHDYWYLRGVAEELHSRKNALHYFQEYLKYPRQHKELEIDLKEGITVAEERIDENRPTNVRIRYGNHVVGNINYWPGAERLRGAHLRLFLATKLSWSLMEILALEQGSSTDNARVIQFF